MSGECSVSLRHRPRTQRLPKVIAAFIGAAIAASAFCSGRACAQPSAPPEAQSSTLSIIAAMPDTAMFALALPSVNQLCAQAGTLSKHFPLAEWTDLVAKTIVESAFGESSPVGISELAEYVRSKGISPDTPWGLFVDMTPTAQDATDAVRKGLQEIDSHTLAPAMAYRPPAYVLMFLAIEPRVAEASVRDALLRIGSGDAPTSSIPDSRFHWVRGHLGYAVEGAAIYVGNSEALFESAVKAQAQPRTDNAIVRVYPEVACDDIILATRLDTLSLQSPDLIAFMPSAQRLMSMFTWDPETPETAERFRELYSPKTGAVPMITTFSVSPDCLRFVSRLDLASHPAYRPAVRHGARTLASLPLSDDPFSAYVNWGDSLKNAVDACVALLPKQLRDGYEQIARRLVEQFASGEACMRVTTGTPPALHAFVGVANSQEAANLMDRYFEKAPAEDSMPTAWQAVLGPLHAYASLAGDVLVVANGRQELKEACGRIQQNEGIPFYRRMTPPLTASEVVSCFSLNVPSEDAFFASAEALGILDANTRARVAPWIRAIRDARAGKVVENNGQTAFLTIYLNATERPQKP